MTRCHLTQLGCNHVQNGPHSLNAFSVRHRCARQQVHGKEHLTYDFVAGDVHLRHTTGRRHVNLVDDRRTLAEKLFKLIHSLLQVATVLTVDIIRHEMLFQPSVAL